MSWEKTSKAARPSSEAGSGFGGIASGVARSSDPRSDIWYCVAGSPTLLKESFALLVYHPGFIRPTSGRSLTLQYRYEKRHKNLVVHVSPTFRVEVEDCYCRTAQFSMLPVLKEKAAAKSFGSLLPLLMLAVWCLQAELGRIPHGRRLDRAQFRCSLRQEVLSESAETVRPNKSYAAARRSRSHTVPSSLRHAPCRRLVVPPHHAAYLPFVCSTCNCAGRARREVVCELAEMACQASCDELQLWIHADVDLHTCELRADVALRSSCIPSVLHDYTVSSHRDALSLSPCASRALIARRRDCVVYSYESAPRRLVSRLQYRIPPTQITCKWLIAWAGGVE
ncbi:hypothetical protein B0H10DRAFT_1943368 [Mycena sp. CBHHK59/15]|nr:hypothetical protein B0H10DRAFT_1943368 [Mycena sp. CBHHK59/15]